jgi:hypothetical protein
MRATIGGRVWKICQWEHRIQGSRAPGLLRSPSENRLKRGGYGALEVEAQNEVDRYLKNSRRNICIFMQHPKSLTLRSREGFVRHKRPSWEYADVSWITRCAYGMWNNFIVITLVLRVDSSSWFFFRSFSLGPCTSHLPFPSFLFDFALCWFLWDRCTFFHTTSLVWLLSGAVWYGVIFVPYNKDLCQPSDTQELAGGRRNLWPQQR